MYEAGFWTSRYYVGLPACYCWQMTVAANRCNCLRQRPRLCKVRALPMFAINCKAPARRIMVSLQKTITNHRQSQSFAGICAPLLPTCLRSVYTLDRRQNACAGAQPPLQTAPPPLPPFASTSCNLSILTPTCLGLSAPLSTAKADISGCSGL